MALVPCPECQKEVSTQALACPQCAFPHPGKQGLIEDGASDKLHPCPDCGLLISKQANSCPHCGVNKLEEKKPLAKKEPLPANDDFTEENWLCTNCGTPYTRKVNLKHGEVKYESHKAPPLVQSNTKMELSHSQILNEFDTHAPEQDNLLPLRSRSPLWQDSPIEKEVDFSPPQSPGKKKTTLILIIVLLVILAVAGSLGALWYFQGISPLDLLSDLGIPLTDTFPSY